VLSCNHYDLEDQNFLEELGYVNQGLKAACCSPRALLAVEAQNTLADRQDKLVNESTSSSELFGSNSKVFLPQTTSLLMF
jgi:hypothetical protein